MGKDRHGDNLAVYGPGDSYCFSCGYRETNRTEVLSTTEKFLSLEDIAKLSSITIVSRRLKKNVTEFYGVKSLVEDGTETVRYYPVTSNGITVSYKSRRLPKTFLNVGQSLKGLKVDFFGQCLFGSQGKILIITEGEEDAMSVYQITKEYSNNGKGYSSVSAPGKDAAKKVLKDNIEWVESFERVVFAFDQEPEALAIARECCSYLSPGKGRIARFSRKDASEMLVAGKEKELFQAIWQAPEVAPSGIVETEDIWTEYRKKDEYVSVKFPEEWGMSEWNYGLYRPALFVLAGGTGSGKSTILKTLQYHLFRETTDAIGVISMEENISLCAGVLMGMHIGKRITLPDVEVSEEEERTAYSSLFSRGRFIFCVSEGLRTMEDLFNKIRFMAIARDCAYIFVDHLTAIINKCSVNEKMSKNDYTEYMVNRLNELAQELRVCIILVSHVRKTGEDSGATYETGKVPLEDSLFGSSAIKQYSHCTLSISRNKMESGSPLFIHVLKDRLSGRSGKSSPLFFDENDGKIKPYVEGEGEDV